MENETANRLKRLNDKIMHIWEERALEEVNASIHQKSLALRNSLPEFLGQISSALLTNVNRTKARVVWDKAESTRVGKLHGRERAASVNYTIDQLIFEYHILRQVIFDVLENEAPLNTDEREIIICGIEQAVNDAATEYSEILRTNQEQFTHTLAHDLRGPITAAKLNAHRIILGPGNTTGSTDIALRITSNMDRLEYMINDLLDVSRLRAGEKLNLTMAPCDLASIIREIADETNFLYSNRIHLKSIAELKGTWSEKGIRRVVENLINNALKYSEPNTTITLGLNKADKDIEIFVHNTGKPIAPEEIDILFQQYRRVNKDNQKAGWGLGLTVVKSITEEHGGTVSVTSTSDAGTTFRVSLPLQENNL